jgi:hypothetical protein
MLFSAVTQVNSAQAAIKFIVIDGQDNLPMCTDVPAQAHTRMGARVAARLALATLLGAALAGCAGGPVGKPLPFYRCEYGLEFTAKFIDDSVAVESTRGYDLLYRGGKYASTPANAKPNSNEYSNARMQIEFNLGVTQREAIVRYPLLPLVSRCVRDN